MPFRLESSVRAEVSQKSKRIYIKWWRKNGAIRRGGGDPEDQGIDSGQKRTYVVEEAKRGRLRSREIEKKWGEGGHRHHKRE